MEEAHNLNCNFFLCCFLEQRQYKNHIQLSIPKIVSGIGTEKNQMAKKVRVSCLMVSSLWVGPSALLEIREQHQGPHNPWKQPDGCRNSSQHPTWGQEKLWLFLVYSVNIKTMKLNHGLGWPQRKWVKFSCRNKTSVVSSFFFLFCSISRKDANQWKGNSELKNY